MLKQRIITAVLLLLALIAATTQLSPFVFAVLIAALVMLASWEWCGFIGLEDRRARFAYIATLGSMLAASFLLIGVTPAAESIDTLRAAMILCLGLVFWLLSLFMLNGYPQSASLWNDESKIASMGLFVLLPTWVGLVQLKYLLPEGYLVLALVVMVAAVDIGAYFTGKSLGRRKLAPRLSPNKSWEGVWGGLALAVIVGLLFSWAMHEYLVALTLIDVIVLVLLSLAVTFFAVIGDLVESMLKRNRNLKDSGTLLPGHGGLLDRVDGLVAVNPVFALTLIVLFTGLE